MTSPNARKVYVELPSEVPRGFGTVFRSEISEFLTVVKKKYLWRTLRVSSAHGLCSKSFSCLLYYSLCESFFDLSHLKMPLIQFYCFITNLSVTIIVLVDGSIDMFVTMNFVLQVMSFFFIAHFRLLILSKV